MIKGELCLESLGQILWSTESINIVAEITQGGPPTTAPIVYLILLSFLLSGVWIGV